MSETGDGNTIKVYPNWTIIYNNNEEITGDILQISGFDATKDDECAKHRLQKFILKKEVELAEPQPVENNLPTDAM